MNRKSFARVRIEKKMFYLKWRYVRPKSINRRPWSSFYSASFSGKYAACFMLCDSALVKWSISYLNNFHDEFNAVWGHMVHNGIYLPSYQTNALRDITWPIRARDLFPLRPMGSECLFCLIRTGVDGRLSPGMAKLSQLPFQDPLHSQLLLRSYKFHHHHQFEIPMVLILKSVLFSV